MTAEENRLRLFREALKDRCACGPISGCAYHASEAGRLVSLGRKLVTDIEGLRADVARLTTEKAALEAEAARLRDEAKTARATTAEVSTAAQHAAAQSEQAAAEAAELRHRLDLVRAALEGRVVPKARAEAAEERLGLLLQTVRDATVLLNGLESARGLLELIVRNAQADQADAEPAPEPAAEAGEDQERAA